jgi:ABC-type dipeptide/oligopeptide/nickel transport system permease component
MLPFLVRRLVLAVVTVFGVATIAFVVAHLIPGDPAMMAAGPQASPADIEATRIALGLDKPLHVQYANYIVNLAHGDLGRSFWTGQTVTHELLVRFPFTAKLAGLSIALAVLLGCLSGVICAVRHNSLIDHVVSFTVSLNIALPVFLVGLLAIYLFSVILGWLPSGGANSIASYVLPALCLSLNSGVIISRMTKSAMLEVLTADYVRTARAKGLSERVVVYKHGLRNALIPIITITGLRLGAILGGAAVTETVFAWPGIGKLAVDAALQRDIPIVTGAAFLVAAAVALLNLIVDMTYFLANPKLKVR